MDSKDKSSSEHDDRRHLVEEVIEDWHIMMKMSVLVSMNVILLMCATNVKCRRLLFWLITDEKGTSLSQHTFGEELQLFPLDGAFITEKIEGETYSLINLLTKSILKELCFFYSSFYQHKDSTSSKCEHHFHTLYRIESIIEYGDIFNQKLTYVVSLSLNEIGRISRCKSTEQKLILNDTFTSTQLKSATLQKICLFFKNRTFNTTPIQYIFRTFKIRILVSLNEIILEDYPFAQSDKPKIPHNRETALSGKHISRTFLVFPEISQLTGNTRRSQEELFLKSLLKNWPNIQLKTNETTILNQCVTKDELLRHLSHVNIFKHERATTRNLVNIIHQEITPSSQLIYNDILQPTKYETEGKIELPTKMIIPTCITPSDKELNVKHGNEKVNKIHDIIEIFGPIISKCLSYHKHVLLYFLDLLSTSLLKSSCIGTPLTKKRLHMRVKSPEFISPSLFPKSNNNFSSSSPHVPSEIGNRSWIKNFLKEVYEQVELSKTFLSVLITDQTIHKFNITANKKEYYRKPPLFPQISPQKQIENDYLWESIRMDSFPFMSILPTMETPHLSHITEKDSVFPSSLAPWGIEVQSYMRINAQQLLYLFHVVTKRLDMEENRVRNVIMAFLTDTDSETAFAQTFATFATNQLINHNPSREIETFIQRDTSLYSRPSLFLKTITYPLTTCVAYIFTDFCVFQEAFTSSSMSDDMQHPFFGFHSLHKRHIWNIGTSSPLAVTLLSSISYMLIYNILLCALNFKCYSYNGREIYQKMTLSGKFGNITKRVLKRLAIIGKRNGFFRKMLSNSFSPESPSDIKYHLDVSKRKLIQSVESWSEIFHMCIQKSLVLTDDLYDLNTKFRTDLVLLLEVCGVSSGQMINEFSALLRSPRRGSYQHNFTKEEITSISQSSVDIILKTWIRICGSDAGLFKIVGFIFENGQHHKDFLAAVDIRKSRCDTVMENGFIWEMVYENSVDPKNISLLLTIIKFIEDTLNT